MGNGFGDDDFAHGGAQGAIATLAYSPDGKFLATGGWDGTVRVWDWLSQEELTRFAGHRGGVLSVAFSNNGRLLASSGSDTSILVWDVSSLKLRKLPMPNAEKLSGAWERLLNRNASSAYAGLVQFVSSPGATVPFLKEHLLQKKTTDEQVQVLLTALDGSSFKARESATRELEGMLPDIEPMLKKALKGSLSAEARGRVDALLAKPGLRKGELSGHQLRQWRAIQALEYVNTEKSFGLLRELATAESEDFLAREASRSLQRMETRIKKTP